LLSLHCCRSICSFNN